ncbi:thymidine phosphorylase-like [Littorina saxatilis]|uniref:Thymidine phosphorylase n=1 Tax=Littorina saxatilis TaxID=31220 RepID=A0AAN9BPU3_9CAEN
MSTNTNIPAIIGKKRDGGQLTEQEIQTFVDAVVSKTAQDAQIGAWLMAVYLKGMTSEEAVHLTRSMMKSGTVLSWPPEWNGLVVDKHSTGGVGDKVSLVLAPALAACGMKVPMISGRGLGHTGGTLDKLEAIPGFSVEMTPKRMHEVLESIGCCIVGQTGELVPADKVLYAIRDVTATVENPQLITGSIISKKAAEGISTLVLDVKTGNGAFMEDREEAEELARLMVAVGEGLGIKTAGLVSTMDSPLGRAVGHAVEVAEAVHCLQGKGPHDLLDLVVKTGGVTLQLAGKASSYEAGNTMIRNVISDGSALAKFRDMVVAQGSSDDVATRLCDVNGDVWKVLTPSAYKTTLKCQKSGVIQDIQAMPCAKAAQCLGAGRTRAGEAIDLAVGLYFTKCLGDSVTEDTPWVTVHHTTPEVPEAAMTLLKEALVIVPKLTSPIADSRVLNIIGRKSLCTTNH